MSKIQGILRGKLAWLYCLALCFITGIAWNGPSSVAYAQTSATAWEVGLPMPNGDPQWETVKSLWNKHWDGKNLDELIQAVTPLVSKYPDRIEPYLWLAKAHTLYAWHHRSVRTQHFKTAEQLMVKALKIDPGNVAAAKILLESLAFNPDRNYVWSQYGALVKSLAPLPIGEALPDLNSTPTWQDFMKLWQQRADLEKGKAAITMLDRFAAENPKDGLALTWASRGNYYMGEVYSSLGEHDTKAMPYYEKGLAYGKKAIRLLPNSAPAHYWLQLNLARSVQFKSKPQQALKLMDLYTNLVFTARENVSYYFGGPLVTLGTMVTNGGWVTEKGMNFIGLTIEIDMLGLELMEVLYPDYYYFAYAKADILRYQGKKKEALAVLEKLIARNPDNNLTLIPENRNFIRFARIMYNEFKQGK